MVDITPLIPGNRQVIERYGDSGFKISGVVWTSSVLVRPTQTLAWDVTRFADLTEASLAPLLDGDVEVLLIGCGARLEMIPPKLRAAVRARGPVIDAMDTGAACRTYNVLLAEDRRVAAALIGL
ncbi:valyl-tRNA synthetase [Elstera litoralis]|uniref:Valyl-tRNA synthetase n=1 Tax=Elstera litoralis TaxID=552518 RepID=A0A0F3IRU5_9PROT|nr:Mth938-like domain-containing protein [Elstera litoralis]KJV08309.1 valyl-tRNA synthetase [Elstera litoralis]